MSAGVVVEQFEKVWQELKRLRQAVEALRAKDEPGFLLPFVSWSVQPSYAYAVSTGDTWIAPIPKSIALIKCVLTAFVWTTNDWSNYWNLRLVLPNNTTIITLTTQGAALNVWNQYSGTTFSPSTLSPSTRYISVFVDKVGTPGNLGLMEPNLFVK